MSVCLLSGFTGASIHRCKPNNWSIWGRARCTSSHIGENKYRLLEQKFSILMQSTTQLFLLWLAPFVSYLKTPCLKDILLFVYPPIDL